METRHENAVRNRFKVLKPVRTKAENGLKMLEEEEQPLSPWASAFRESGSDLYVIAILGSKTRVDPCFIKENLAHNVLQNPRFSSLQVIDEKSGKMKWVKTSINMADHVIVSEENQKVESAEKFLEDYVSNISRKPMNNSKPLWEFHILNLRVYDSESVGVFRIHHSLGDGFSLLTHLLASTRKVSNPEALPSFPVKKKAINQETDQRGFWCKYFVTLWWVLGLFWNTMVDAVMLMATALFLKDTKTPLTRSTSSGSSSSSSSSRRFVYKSLSLDDITLVKNATNTTINDVILAVIQRGLSLYLNRMYGEESPFVKATEESNNLPKNIRFRAIVPVSLRLPTIHNLSDGRKEKKDKHMKGNKFGYVVLPLTIAVKDDPLDYIRSAKAIMDRKKHSLEAFFTSTIAKFLLDFFGTKGATLLSYKIPSHTTMVFSNVPGPREEVSYLGYPISFIAPTSYGLPNGLSMHALSYSNKVSIVLSVDESTVSNPHQLGADLEESLKLIKEAVIMP